jgi:hypothetical protein
MNILGLAFLFLALGTWVLIIRSNFRDWIGRELTFDPKTNQGMDLIFRFVGYGTPLILLSLVVFVVVLVDSTKSLKWTDATDNLVSLIVLIISLISIGALFVLYALQPKVTVPIPLLSSQDLRHRRALTWASLLTLVCIAGTSDPCIGLTG